MAVDAAGNVYVADLGNNRIRLVSPSGATSTLAGSATRSFADGVGTAASFYVRCVSFCSRAFYFIVAPFELVCAQINACLCPHHAKHCSPRRNPLAWPWTRRVTCTWRIRITTASGS